MEVKFGHCEQPASEVICEHCARFKCCRLLHPSSHDQNWQSSNKQTSATTQKFAGQDRILDVSQRVIREKSLRHLRKKHQVKLGALKKMASIQVENEHKLSGNRMKSQLTIGDDQRS